MAPPLKSGIITLVEFLDSFKILGYDISDKKLDDIMTEITQDIKLGKLIKKV